MKASYAVCINNRGYAASLELLKVYCVLPDRDAEQHAQMRVIDESGEDYLYSRDRFAPVAVPLVVRKVCAARHVAEYAKVVLVCFLALCFSDTAHAAGTWTPTANMGTARIAELPELPA
jgi:hypothetical protein